MLGQRSEPQWLLLIISVNIPFWKVPMYILFVYIYGISEQKIIKTGEDGAIIEAPILSSSPYVQQTTFGIWKKTIVFLLPRFYLVKNKMLCMKWVLVQMLESVSQTHCRPYGWDSVQLISLWLHLLAYVYL